MGLLPSSTSADADDGWRAALARRTFERREFLASLSRNGDHGVSGLGVPVVVAEQVVCALVVWARRSAPRWPDPVVERVRLIAEIYRVAHPQINQPGLFAGARLGIGRAWSVVLRSRLHYLLYNVDKNNRSFGTWEATAFLQYDFGGHR